MTGNRQNLKGIKGYFDRLDRLHNKKGYVVAKDLKMPWLLASVLLWFGWKTGNLYRMSTVVNDGKVICYHDRSTLRGHSHYPNARVETRFTVDKNLFRDRVFQKEIK
jgi:hypothetical protein